MGWLWHLTKAGCLAITGPDPSRHRHNYVKNILSNSVAKGKVFYRMNSITHTHRYFLKEGIDKWVKSWSVGKTVDAFMAAALGFP